MDIRSGEVGTRTLWRFDARYLGLAGRCEQYLAGLSDPFPRPTVRQRRFIRIPRGEANLRFGNLLTAHRGAAAPAPTTEVPPP